MSDFSRPSGPSFTQSPQPSRDAASTFTPTQTAGIITVLQQMLVNQSLLISAINNKFPDWVAAPANSASTGVAGQVSYSVGFFYVCVGPSHWQRVAIADF